MISPSDCVYFPEGQRKQVGEATVDAYFPARQSTQLLLPLFEYVPTGQSTHNVWPSDD